jgi:hypothetical protein
VIVWGIYADAISQDNNESASGPRAVGFIAGVCFGDVLPDDALDIASWVVEASNETLRKQHLAKYHRDCQQADRILQSLKSCTDSRLDEIAEDVVLDMNV